MKNSSITAIQYLYSEMDLMEADDYKRSHPSNQASVQYLRVIAHGILHHFREEAKQHDRKLVRDAFKRLQRAFCLFNAYHCWVGIVIDYTYTESFISKGTRNYSYDLWFLISSRDRDVCLGRDLTTSTTADQSN